MPFYSLRLRRLGGRSGSSSSRLRPFSLVFGAFLGLLAGFASLRVVGGGAFLDAGLVEQAGNAVGRLGANAEPVAHAVFDQAHAVFGVLGEQRVVGAHLLQILAIAGARLLEATIL
jgi:hypothetical protein